MINQLNELQTQYKKLGQEDRKVLFYEKRTRYNVLKVNGDELENLEKATLFIFLNKTCFNGLYRVNSQGQFNVLFGNYKNPRIVNENNLLNCSELLKNTEIKCADFSEILTKVKKGDFVYFDPPYVPLNETSSFTSYTKDGFDMDMQFKLREVCDELDSMGVMFMLSDNPQALIPYTIPKFIAFAVLRISFVTSLGSTSYNQLAVLVWKSSLLLNESIIGWSSDIWAKTRSSICE